MQYVQSNLDGDLFIPFKGEMVRFAPGANGLDDGLLKTLTGGFLSNGKARNGRAATYFNQGEKPLLQRMGAAPVSGEECNIIKSVPGVRQSRRTKRIRAEESKMAVLEEKIAALTALIGGASAEEPILDPADYTVADLSSAIDGLSVVELVDVLRLETAKRQRSGAITLLTDAIKG